MATKKKTEPDQGITIAQDLVGKVGSLYAVLDESAGNSNYLKDIAENLDRIAKALENRNERQNT